MKNPVRLFLLSALMTLAFVSCGTMNTASTNYSTSTSSGYELGSTKRLSGKVFQTINQRQALVKINTQSYETILVLLVLPENSKEYLFDDLAVEGQYVFIGTYKYTTNSGMQKTVPVYVEKKNYVPGMEWDDLFKRIKTP